VDPDGPGLREAILHHTQKRKGGTFFRGSKPIIDGLWITSDIDISNACVMPFGYGVGGHRLFALDVTIESLIGTRPQKIVRPASRRLNSKIPHFAEAYIRSLEANITQHRLIEKLHEVHISDWSHAEKERQVCANDQAGKEFMTHAEKVCRKIKCCRIPYSPEVSIWIKRAQVYYLLLRYRKGK
jgi:hypothetical protein